MSFTFTHNCVRYFYVGRCRTLHWSQREILPFVLATFVYHLSYLDRSLKEQKVVNQLESSKASDRQGK